MKIRVEIPWGYKGDVYDFTLYFGDWLQRELESRLIEAEAFTAKYGKDWTLTFAWNTEKRIKQPKLSGHWTDRKHKEMRCMFDLPYFRRVPADPQAYVPQIRQFLHEVAAFLSREQIDTSKLERDIEQLLEQFCVRPGMIEYDPHPYTFDAEKKAAKRLVLSEKAKVLKTDAAVRDCLSRLPRDFKHRFSMAFDATDHPARKKGWQGNCAVIDLTVEMPVGKSGLSQELFAAVTELFRSCAIVLERNRTFFCLRIVPKPSKPDWSVAILLSDQHNDAIHKQMAQEAAIPIVSLMLQNAEFRKTVSDTPHLLVAYSGRQQRIIGFQSEIKVAFDLPYSKSSEIEQELMSDNCGNYTTQTSGVFLGNVSYALKDYRVASEQWERAANAGVVDAPFCVAVANSKLGNMEKAFEFCKKAVEIGDPPKRFNDPELGKFRSHPLFANLKEWIKARRDVRENQPQPLTPRIPLPKWKIPKNIQKRVDDEDGMWEDERFDPILLTVMSGVEHEGRDIPLSWQIEFDPYDDRLKSANRKLESSDIEPDGDGWAEFIEKEFAKRYPKLADELHSDSESSTCVLWVESEGSCKKLIELVWSLIYLK